MTFRRVPGFLLLVAGLALLCAAAMPVHAQDAPLKITIDRPGIGETYYTGPYGPRTLVPVAGHVSGGTFDLVQLEVRLELLQDGILLGQESTSPDAGGAFRFRMMINATGSAELSTPESNCFTCHEVVNLVAPAGAFVLRLTAIDPSGNRVVVERPIKLDHSGVTTLPVKPVVAGDDGRTPQGLPVEARTLIFGWRGRTFEGKTGANGLALLPVEVLSLRPAEYRLSVPPLIIDGVLYQTAAPVPVTIPAGAATMNPITLSLRAQLGRLSGRLTLPTGTQAPDGPLTVTAVELPYGRTYSGPASEGRFSLEGLPLGRFLAGLEQDQASALGLQARLLPVDFAGQTAVDCDLPPAVSGGRAVRGTLLGTDDVPIPFGWITADGSDAIAQVDPVTGAFIFSSVPANCHALSAAAPGYWSRTIPAAAGRPLAVRLEAKPGTRVVNWGSGTVVLPEETLVAVDGDRVHLQRGWLWGQGDRQLTITTPEAEITIAQGAFAVEYLAGERGWLYLKSGQAEINRGSEPAADLAGGQMCAFAGREVTRLVPAPLSANAVAVLAAGRPRPVGFEPQPGFWPAAEAALALTGLLNPGAPVMATALLAGAACFGVAFVIWRRRRDHHAPRLPGGPAKEGQ
ncbi:MAG TPA: hypothetical protein VGA61_10565 [Anaerolineae bacterium]